VSICEVEEALLGCGCVPFVVAELPVPVLGLTRGGEATGVWRGLKTCGGMPDNVLAGEADAVLSCLSWPPDVARTACLRGD
jgi:hypothetical protein